MKKLTAIAGAFLLFLSTTAFAKEKKGKDEVVTKVKTAFAKDFARANETTWNITNGFYIARFTLNNTTTEAAYNGEGELVGFSRRVKKDDLPLAISMAISNKYAGYQVAAVADEVTYEKETNYYINIANDKEQLKLKCSVNGDISVDRKIRE